MNGRLFNGQFPEVKLVPADSSVHAPKNCKLLEVPLPRVRAVVGLCLSRRRKPMKLTSLLPDGDRQKPQQYKVGDSNLQNKSRTIRDHLNACTDGSSRKISTLAMPTTSERKCPGLRTLEWNENETRICVETGFQCDKTRTRTPRLGKCQPGQQT